MIKKNAAARKDANCSSTVVPEGSTELVDLQLEKC